MLTQLRTGQAHQPHEKQGAQRTRYRRFESRANSQRGDPKHWQFALAWRSWVIQLLTFIFLWSFACCHSLMRGRGNDPCCRFLASKSPATRWTSASTTLQIPAYRLTKRPDPGGLFMSSGAACSIPGGFPTIAINRAKECIGPTHVDVPVCVVGVLHGPKATSQ
ncbi:hypothetical protein CC79DRAFT_172701 [Sarocladium strictum]